MWYIYILICADERTYVGCTNNLDSRLIRHNKGFVLATKDRLPVKLIGYFAIKDEKKAFAFEKYLKTGVGRVFIKKRIFS
ncbi:MAG: excinuclease ABC C subunit domain-containing protein [Microgenomates group bacterium GW2011_GWC1_37_8]|uniref:Excinuclease ABC C subunit domain-containing protein n=2 Tax=Candidatus Woeseibacteriota TaxID=1752722 RepID=A0A0G0L3Q4_9BACT|nr:MAG: excinuclease ABC C subunit domain-containing protein [Microgenomates group bacterium GW2011_GWC1_37_8]KKQ85622.1 MAG: excinuclease ABC C subunit domain-containing protein [Candidatus Woesebacteria bacterium GW2011_GWB1_38_8]OGM21643.1 MAG: excinuclease ABC subunit C [Candidatus Woesebacteria bacterium RIFCSPHIGHO2_01_FULL_38_9b]